MSYFDEELTADLKIFNICFDILSEIEHASIVSKMNEKLPFSGSKISWSNLEASINFGLASSDLAISRLAEEIRRLTDGDLIFIGDSACDEAYSINSKHIEKAIKIFSELPQHTYVISKSLTWIACISFEGDLDFVDIL
ncbi:hypothetical protein [Pseudomonas marginalis]|uniref:hypothetical protein n=1 Tax=Pseudomonas marginalis TaxID=298 RepID=UPI00069B44D5|nr:hypothetical protein [Pseudomonas marginalis]